MENLEEKKFELLDKWQTDVIEDFDEYLHNVEDEQIYIAIAIIEGCPDWDSLDNTIFLVMLFEELERRDISPEEMRKHVRRWHSVL